MNIKGFALNTTGRDFVCGDIHGRMDLLQEKLNEVSFDFSCDRLFSVGDLIDRGEFSKEVVEFFMQNENCYSVLGNHEEMALNSIDADEYDLWIMNGGSWWHRDKDDPEFVSLFGKFLTTRPVLIEVETQCGLTGIVHADIPYNLSWDGLKERIHERDIRDLCLWSRHRISHQEKITVAGVEEVFVGHTPLKTMGSLANVFFIDTGAVFVNNLTLIEL